MIRVEPLPEGTTDINTLEAGWQYVDENRIVIYGAITSNPLQKLSADLTSLADAVQSASDTAFKNKSSKDALVSKLQVIKRQVINGDYAGALEKLNNDVAQKTDGYVVQGKIDGNDWVTSPDVQTQLCWAIREITILFDIIK